MIDGAWVITRLEIDGEPMPAAGRIIMKGDRFTTESMGAEYAGISTVAAPNIDLRFTTGPEKGNTARGIFDLSGDELRICLTLTATERPTEFRTWPGSGLALETLRRDSNPNPAAPVEIPADLAPAPELDGQWELLELAMDGPAMDPEYVKSGRRTCADNEFKVRVMGRVIVHAKFSLDRSTEPWGIDYYVYGAGKRVFAQYGLCHVYRGLLTTAVGSPGRPRPSALAPGPGVTYTVWRRLGNADQ